MKTTLRDITFDDHSSAGSGKPVAEKFGCTEHVAVFFKVGNNYHSGWVPKALWDSLVPDVTPPPEKDVLPALRGWMKLDKSDTEFGIDMSEFSHRAVPDQRDPLGRRMKAYENWNPHRDGEGELTHWTTTVPHLLPNRPMLKLTIWNT